ncbi:hypothetical protein [Shivajiella indica]|uniref:Uncharacterized protein n=1 Tax=Shivajiella indica TaxID=872115 RepID=A0ABW5B4E6_9BACT
MSLPAAISRFQSNEEFSFWKVSKKDSLTGNIIDPVQILESCGMVELVGTASFDFPNFPEANKSFNLINFKLTNGFTELKGLLNGLISIGKPIGVMAEFEKERGIYSLKYYKADEPTVNAYLKKIFRIVSEEIRFKLILRKLIENQKAFAKEEQLLKAELFA